MSYTPNIPVIGQSLGASRPGINSNFQYINTWAKQNHYFNETNGGRHKFVELPVLGAVPSAGSRIANEVTLYSKTANGASQLFMVRNTGSNEIQLTTASGSDVPVNNDPGWSFLPGGVIIQWGIVSTAGSSGSVTYPLPLNFTPYSVILSCGTNSGGHSAFNAYVVGTPSTTKFNYEVTVSSFTVHLNWIVIGSL